MDSQDSFKTYGVFVPDDVFDAVSEHLYTEAGVIEFEEYFSANTDTVPRGDPAAEVTAIFAERVVDNFADVYDSADFEAAQTVGHDEFQILTLAVTSQTFFSLKDLFRAAERIQVADSRTVHTAILRAALSELELPSIPENTVRFEDTN